MIETPRWACALHPAQGPDGHWYFQLTTSGGETVALTARGVASMGPAFVWVEDAMWIARLDGDAAVEATRAAAQDAPAGAPGASSDARSGAAPIHQGLDEPLTTIHLVLTALPAIGERVPRGRREFTLVAAAETMPQALLLATRPAALPG